MESSDASHTSEKPHPKAFVCLYAQRDKPMYRELQKYLVLWKNQGRIYWADPASIQQADLILLFISPDFFATRGCQMGMVHALEVRTERGIPVIPVLARASNWKESACGALKALPDNDRPIVEWRQKERAYENICTGLARLLPDLPALGIALREGLSLFQARDLPQGYVARPTEFTAAKQLLLHRQGAQVAVITTALRGAGGFGKTTLALALCHDSEIQAAFPDGILWVELGEHPPRPIDVINNILVSLEPSHPKAMTLEEAKKRWRAALHDRVCLLVIDDIWQAEVLLPLLEGGPYCRRLVTTRNDLLLPNDAARVLVDAMDLREAVTLLCQDLPEEIFQATYQPQLEALAARLGYWPLLLTLARGMLTDLIAYGQSITEALTTVANAYQKRGVTAFRLDNAEERQQTVEACLRVSVQHLEKFTHPDYHATERYQELAVFPADTDIPLATLQIYWKGSAGNLELWETKDLCIRLHRLSLLLHCDLGTGTIRLHEVLRSYLVQRAGSHLPVLHGCLLDACQQEHGLIRWADLPAQEHYLWHHLVWHLCQANRQEALLATLTDLLYLSRKALYIGIPALEADFLLASTFQPTDIGEPARSLFEFLSQTIARLSHLLRQVHSVAEMSGFLLSHLGAHAFFARRKPVWEHELPRPFLTAWHPLPSESSSLLQRTLHGHAGRVTSCAISPDGRFIVSASYDGTLRVWETTTGAQRFSCKGGAHPSSTASLMGCAVSPDGNFVVSTCEDGSLKMWDAATGVEYLSLRAAIGLGSCTVSPDNRFIVSASADNLSHRHNLLKVWDTQTGVELLSLSGHRGSVLSCAVSPDGKWIVSASADRTLKIWDAITGVQRLTLKGHTDRVTGCAVSPDGKWIISASADDTLKVWDAITGVQHLTFKGHTGSVTGCAVSPDGRFIVSASDDKTLKMWNATTGAEYLTLTGHTGPVTGCAVSPDGRFIVSASDDRTLKVWKTAPTGIERLPLTNRTSWVTDCAVSPNGRFIVFVSGDKTLKVWDVTTGAERLIFTDHIKWITGCAVSPDGKWIVSASADRTLKVWETATGAQLLTLTGHTDEITSCAVSPNGRLIVSASRDKTLKVWKATTGAQRFTLTGHTLDVFNCTVSPDGKWIVSASADRTLKVWETATGAQLLTLTGHTNSIFSCVVSPDGRRIVSASGDDTLKVWDVATGAQCLTLSGHADTVHGCAMSPNGNFIVSASSDKTLKVWDVQTGQCLLTFPVDGALFCCAFHPDGEHLVACGDQGVFFLRLIV